MRERPATLAEGPRDGMTTVQVGVVVDVWVGPE